MELPGLREYYDQLWAATDPSRPHGPARLSGHGRASVTALLPRIGLARRLIVEVTACPLLSPLCLAATGASRLALVKALRSKVDCLAELVCLMLAQSSDDTQTYYRSTSKPLTPALHVGDLL